MKLGICGTFGTGRSSLALDMSEILSCSLVPDVALDVLRGYGFRTWDQFEESGQKKIFEVQREIIEKKIKLERKAGNSFVSDATVIEPFIIFGYVGSKEDMEKLYNIVYSHVVNTYNMIVFIRPFRPYTKSSFFDSYVLKHIRSSLDSHIESFLYDSWGFILPIAEMIPVVQIKSTEDELRFLAGDYSLT